MNIFKSFEIFLREPLSVLRDKFIQIVSIQTGDPFGTFSMKADLMDKKTQITVVNSKKVYHLLETVMYKQRLREQQEKNLIEQK
ncbi:hypothetical protein SDC9_212169 [bioreactor metagenome]|uniref:Uncharacterized protein n=1 Tax=bioreactor metagenome TaxID=1076179 RepID=A0A645JM27_9ZZZZ